MPRSRPMEARAGSVRRAPFRFFDESSRFVKIDFEPLGRDSIALGPPLQGLPAQRSTKSAHQLRNNSLVSIGRLSP